MTSRGHKFLAYCGTCDHIVPHHVDADEPQPIRCSRCGASHALGAVPLTA